MEVARLLEGAPPSNSSTGSRAVRSGLLPIFHSTLRRSSLIDVPRRGILHIPGLPHRITQDQVPILSK